MSMSCPAAKGVDGPVLLGTLTPVLSGTRVPYYWERARPVTIWRDKADSSPSNSPNSESFGLLLTRPGKSRHCGRPHRISARRASGGRKTSEIYASNCHGMAIPPTEKPSSLIEILIRTSCPQSGLVGDWFAGSGTAGEACRLSGRRYLGCGIDAGMAELARVRIASVLPFAEGAQP